MIDAPRHQATAGYHGRYLDVNVSSCSAKAVDFPPDVLRSYLGGSGLGTWLMERCDAATCEPLSAEAPLAFVFSPLVGSPLTTSAKFAVVCKSPLTDRINDSLASSAFALHGKRTGFDAIVLRGRAPEPSVLVIDNGKVRLEPADALWGLSSEESEQRLRSRLGASFQTAVIGPGGERKVLFATISHSGRHAGRGGSGAVMGAKNLKAIAVRGSNTCTWHDPSGLAAYAKQLSERSFGPATAKYRELGTAYNLLLFNRLSVLPSRNFQRGRLEGVEAIAPETLSAARQRTRASCAACTIGCEHLYELHHDDQGKARQVRLEYESLFALGPLCGVTDAELVLAASQRCDHMGLDTISAGGTIAFAMECVERGRLDAPWLEFGDGRAVLRALDEIAAGVGLGPLLAQGSRRMAHELGGDVIAFAPQVKGLELPGYDPRGLQTMALGLAVGTRGADHNRSGAYEADFSGQVNRRCAGPEAALFAVATEDKAALMDSLILCKFLRGVFEDFYGEAAAMLRLITGWDATPAELQATARRIIDAKKRFNIAAGWTPAEDTLPPRLLGVASPDDPEAYLSPERLQSLIAAYNKARGWSAEGWLPT